MTAVRVTIAEMKESHVDAAVELFRAAYQRERVFSPLLPCDPLGGQEAVATSIHADLANPGVVALDGERLVGYLCMSARFPFKGQQAALVREHGHATVLDQSRLLYQELYAALAELLVRKGIHLHIIAHFSGDQELKGTLFQLGFGAFLAESLRDLSPVATPSTIASVEPEREPRALLSLEREHRRYYRQSPIFLIKDDSEPAAFADLQERLDNGQMFFVCRELQAAESGLEEPCAYMIVGRCTGDQEGHLLSGSNSAQIYSAYARPSARGKGIGKALLSTCVDWARREHYDRLFVEHETANLLGSRFWDRHFAPYLYFSMRYVENRL